MTLESPDPEESPDLQGAVRPVSAAALTAWAVVGLVGGWLLRPVSEGLNGSAVIVSWAQPLGLGLVLSAVAVTAWHTWQAVQVRRERLEPHRAVNRLVLGRAAALVGVLMAGGYAGYLVSWLGTGSEQAHSVMLRAAVASLVAGLVAVAGLGLERACRVPKPSSQA